MSEDYVGVRGYRQPSACEQRDLIQQMKAGDVEARETLIRSNMPLVFRIARETSTDDYIDDAIQEGAIKMWKVAEKYNPERAKFSTIAWICVQRKIRDAVRTESRKRYAPLEEDFGFNEPYLFEEQEYKSRMSEQVREAVSELPPRERFVITFHHGLYEEKPLSLRAIGKQLKISPEYVRRIEQKALQKLRRSLQQSA